MVTTILQNAFRHCLNLKFVNLTHGLETIGDSCFTECSNLQKVILPETITSLGGGIFNKCHKDIIISFDENSKFLIDDNYFITDRGSTKLSQYVGSKTEIVIPGSIVTLQLQAFKDAKIVKVEFGAESKLKSIEEECFSGCTELTTIVFPNTLEEIGMKAFINCNSLSSIVTLGPKFNVIGEKAFCSCHLINSVVFDINSPIITIDKETFFNCSNLETVSFSNNLVNINERAFKYWGKLSKVAFPATIKTIGMEAFYETGIKTCEFKPEAPLTVFSNHLFYNCTNLQTVVYPTHLQIIGKKALAFTKIGSVELPKDIEELGEYCFFGCEDLVKFSIPSESKLKTINYGVFSQCPSFKEITTNSANFVTEQGALYDANKTKLYILPQSSPRKYFSFPETVSDIAAGALLECKNIKMIFIPESTKTIGESAFESCTSLKSINIPLNVISVGENAFKGCKGLTCDISIENRTPEYIAMLE